MSVHQIEAWSPNIYIYIYLFIYLFISGPRLKLFITIIINLQLVWIPKALPVGADSPSILNYIQI